MAMAKNRCLSTLAEGLYSSGGCSGKWKILMVQVWSWWLYMDIGTGINVCVRYISDVYIRCVHQMCVFIDRYISIHGERERCRWASLLGLTMWSTQGWETAWRMLGIMSVATGLVGQLSSCVTGSFILSCHSSLSGPEEWARVHQAEVGSGQFLRRWPRTLHQLQQERQAKPLLPVSQAASQPKTSLEAAKCEMPPVGHPETLPFRGYLSFYLQPYSWIFLVLEQYLTL